MKLRTKKIDNPRRARVARERRLKGLSKRRKFLIVAILLAIYLLLAQRIEPGKRAVVFVGYFVVSYILSGWSLSKDLEGVEWFTNLVLPSLFPVSVGLFYFLLPQRGITRLIVAGIFMVGMYALLLTQNIFAVASIRTIQLLRAARAVGFLLTIITGAFLFDVILSMRLGAIVTVLLVFVVSLLLFVQGLWSSTLEDRLSARVWRTSLLSAIVVAETALALSYWNIDVAMGSIFLAMVVYVLLGIFQHKLEERLFKRTMEEYLGFGLIVFVVVSISVIFRWMS